MTEGRSGFEVVLEHIRAGILDGTLTAGGRLPPERELAAQLDVGRGSVREAIRALQAQGVLVSISGPGNGTIVQPAHIDAIGQVLELHLALASISFTDVSQTRAALERAAMSSSAAVRRAEPLTRAGDLHDRMREPMVPEDFNALDTSFHVALAQAGDNQLLSDLAGAIRRSVHSTILLAEHRLTDWPAFQQTLVAEHGAMLDAALAGDPDAAAMAVEEHVNGSYRVLLGSPTPSEDVDGEPTA